MLDKRVMGVDLTFIVMHDHLIQFRLRSYGKRDMAITHGESICIVHPTKESSHLRIILQIAEHILTHQFNLL